ncbi:MAG: hypothetical protein D6723_09370 [Acidobacteria bacterium]|nr:MAG: hypothetical protein D6723_09370 [Acidobacteriota bacterium]
MARPSRIEGMKTRSASCQLAPHFIVEGVVHGTPEPHRGDEKGLVERVAPSIPVTLPDVAGGLDWPLAER